MSFQRQLHTEALPVLDMNHKQNHSKTPTTSHPLRWLTSKTVTSVGKDVEKLAFLHTQLAGFLNSAATGEKSLAFSHKVPVTARLSNSTPRCTPKRNGNMCPHENLYMDAHRTIIHNSQMVETTPVLTTRGMNKYNVVYPGNGNIIWP